MINRSREEILAKMLDALVKGETSSTRLLYSAMMSNNQCKSYLSFLIEKGFITISKSEEVGKRKHYFITEKGRELLHIFDEMNSMVTVGVEPEVPSYQIKEAAKFKFEQNEKERIEMAAKSNPSREAGRPKISKSMMETAQLVSEKMASVYKNRPKTTEREDVKTLWENGMRNTRLMGKVLGLTRGVVYNHLRGLGLKPKKRKD